MPDHLRGTLSDAFTLNIDLAPTLLSAAGVQVPQHMQGRDIADLYLGDYKKNRKGWRKDFFYEWSQGRAVDAAGHPSEDHIPAVFALVRKDYKVSEKNSLYVPNVCAFA
jgi:arylsulfatase